MRKPTSPRIELGKRGHELLDRACGAMQARNHDAARPLCRKLYAHLPKVVRERMSFEAFFETVETAMLDETPGGACCGRRHFCACCALDDIVLAAGFDTDAHGCAHEHRVRKRNDDSLFVNYQVQKPKPKAAPGYTSDSSADSGLSSRSASPPSDGGRVARARPSPRVAASPYARPTVPRHARVTSSPGPVDAITDGLAAMNPFAGHNIGHLADRDVAQLADLFAGYTIAEKPQPAPEPRSVFAFAFGVGAASYAPPALPAFALPPYPRGGAYYH